jgi:haloalkane dehalogenase
VFVPGGVKRRKLSAAEKAMYKAPHPTPASRVPVHVMPREILSAHELLTEVEQGLPRLAHLPALIVCGDRDQAFKEPQRPRGDHRRDPGLVARGAAAMSDDDAQLIALGGAARSIIRRSASRARADDR